METFENIRLVYGRVLNGVQAGLRVANLPATGRVKTIGTLVDKLRRTPGLTIRGVHDLAGTRVIVPDQIVPKGFEVQGLTYKRDVNISNGRFAQDVVVSTIERLFAPPVCSKPPKVLDRRAEPSSGYRAVHVIVFYDGIPVEVQVRTDLQHMWAELAERLGDRWGRGLRYGLGPDEPDSEVVPGEGVTRRAFVEDILGGLAEGVNVYEQSRYKFDLMDLRLSLAQDQQEGSAVWQDVEEMRRTMVSARDDMRGLLTNVLTVVEGLVRP